MQLVKVLKMNSKPFTGQYGATNKVGIQTDKHGDKWLNGFVSVVDFVVGDHIFIDVENKGEFINFKYKGKDVANQPQNTKIAPNLQENSTQKPNWDKISFGKCKHAFLLEFFKHYLNKEDEGKSLNFTKWEKQAEELAKMSMRKLNEPELKNYGNGEELDQVDFFL